MTDRLDPLAPLVPQAPIRHRERQDLWTIAQMLGWLGVAALVVNALQVLHAPEHSKVLQPLWINVVYGALALVGLAQLWQRRHDLKRSLSSLHFGIAVLLSVGAATALGTCVVQTANPTVFYARYGQLAPAMTWLHLQDVFHSAWFLGLLALFVVGLLVSIVARKAWKFKQMGFLLTHGGTVLLIAGGLWGMLAGGSGIMHLQTGETTQKFTSSNGKPSELPFAVTLDRFAVEKRAPEYRVSVVEKQDGPERVVASFDANVPAVHAVAGFGRVEVRGLKLPSESSAGQSGPAWPQVEVKLHSDNGDMQDVLLAAGADAAVPLGRETLELRFGKKGDDVVNFQSSLGIGQGAERQKTAKVQVNQPMEFGGYSLYQGSYDPKNPRYSGILVVKDPGVTLAYVGLIACILGLIRIVWWRPRRADKTGAA